MNYTDGVFTHSIYFKPDKYNFEIEVCTNFNFIDKKNDRFSSNYSISTVFLIPVSRNCILVNCKSNWAEKGSFFRIFSLIFLCLCQVEGHGETLPKFSLKIVKNFSLQIWKILCFVIWLCGPLSHGIWILDLHPSVKTLAFLDHCAWRSWQNYFIGKYGQHL